MIAESDRWYESIPPGPLTRDSFNNLAIALYDDPFSPVAKYAQDRGIVAGDYLRVKFAELITLPNTPPMADIAK